MNLRKPIKTTVFIVLLALDLIIFSFFLASKNVLNKEYLSSKVKDFSFISYVKERDYINTEVRAFKYPIEVFDYIDMDEFYKVMDGSIDKLLESKTPLLDGNEIVRILEDSVNKYDQEHDSDSLRFAKDDINRVSTEFAYKLNNDGLVCIVKIMVFCSSGIIFYIPILIAILLSVYICLDEKREGFLINGIVYIVYSLYLYLLNIRFINGLVRNGSIYTYFDGFKSYTFKLEPALIICFILGFVLLLIYIGMYIKKLIRDVRLHSYENWR